MTAALTQLSSSKCFDGHVLKYRHASATLGCDMQFSVFLPSAAADGPVPALIFLSGLTCNEDNFITKAGACQYASKHGVALVCPDSSPRGVNCKDDKETWDFGEGASYYVDATTDEYKKHYQMYSYVTDEFYNQVIGALPIDKSRISLFGHSVGGHGALTIGLRNPAKFRSISAFAPMSNPTNCAWGQKAFTRFLGDSDPSLWSKYDATLLAEAYAGPKVDVLIDQGSKDNFLAQYLHTSKVVDAMKANDKINVEYRLRDGYDHGYWYIQSFVEEHIKWHAERLA
ncbi:esterase D/formylglutathione hydrolase-like protein [Catenaria anguillulae PL171]|uniref:S-formylglutathione hydrolase n=1 Tax=Catenaria anguillulae PL171 TaxID=765915 RepID=A0A1Y2HVB4_9FUNG|nr:esterase D/formylglutathione hydrolase-like protein [Catenaria anguillulae PL171]